MQCPTCLGTGYFEAEWCEWCEGKGRILNRLQIEANQEWERTALERAEGDPSYEIG